MSIGVLYSGTWFFVLVNTHPLVQNIQPYPVPNYQQYAYQPPYSDVLMVLPNNINHYSQPGSIQTPLVTYQTLQTPSLINEVPQIYWDKLPAGPTLQKVLDTNKVFYDQYSKDIQTNLQPYNTGGVVNNYIIVPPDYLRYNETVAKDPISKRVRNELRRPVKKNVTSNQRKRKVSNNKRVDMKDVKSPNIKTLRIVKQNGEPSWNFNTDNIKCFTPADILENEKYQPEKKINKNKEGKKQYDRKCNKRNPKSSTDCENKDRSEKSTKKKRNKVKKKSTKNGKNERKEKSKNISSLNKTDDKTKKPKKSSTVCTCAKQENLPDFETKILEDIPPFCDQDINDFLLSHLLHQDCSNLENRQTRNSKTYAAKKDSRNIYLDLPGDTSWNWYMNDLYSQQSLQDALNSNLFQGNKYPFDYTQIYQIPHYSNTDVKSSGNTERNNNTRRKKKKKKKKNPRKENVSSGDDRSHSLISDPKIQITETNIEIPDTSSQVSDVSTQFSEKSTHASPESKIKVATMINDNYQNEFTPVSPKDVKLETVYTTSTEKVTEHFKDPILPLAEFLLNTNLKTLDQNLTSEENDSKEIYETQIPIAIVEHLDNEKEKIMDERLPILESHIYSQLPELGTEDEMFNMFLNDYYPDFRADNLAYLVSEEEENYHNVHDRYFYVSDKNLDSREIYSSEHFNQRSNEGVIYSDDDIGNYNLRHNEHRVKEKGKSQEIVFRTPPGLEVPDFRTRKINNDIEDSTEIYHEDNDYEKDFVSFADKSNNFIKTVKGDDNNSEHLVETVYARSKVVKYGPGQELDKSSIQEAKVNFSELEDTTIQNSGDTTIVVAKSLRPVDFR